MIVKWLSFSVKNPSPRGSQGGKLAIDGVFASVLISVVNCMNSLQKDFHEA